jgi:UDP-glucose 4-epimerase
VPTYLGFDPRVQFVHESDAIDAFVAAVKNPVRGAVNVAAPGTIGLTRMVRMAGKLTLPVAGPLFPGVTEVARRAGLLEFSPDFSRLLRYGRAVDTRRLVEEVGFEPRYDAVEAIEDYVRHQGGRRLVPAPRRVVAR